MKPRAKLVVGLTGGIATGKSTVLGEFKKLGAKTFSMDEVAHEVLKDKKVAAKVLRRFGTVDRKELGRKVFGKKSELAALERLLHPEILERTREAVRKVPKGVCVVDVPLLFEKKLMDHFHVTLAVFAPESEQRRRLSTRDGMAAPEALKRIALQWPIEKKCRAADVVIDNSQPWPKVAPIVAEYYRAFELLAHGSGR